MKWPVYYDALVVACSVARFVMITVMMSCILLSAVHIVFLTARLAKAIQISEGL